MKYSHYSYLPIGAFEPILGKIKLYGGGGNPVSAISDFVSNAVSDVGNAISSGVSDVAQTVGDVGNQIDQAVNDNVPGGWALPVAVTAAVVAPEILPELIDAAPVSTAVGADLADAELGQALAANAPDVVSSIASSADPAVASSIAETAPALNVAPELNTTGSLASQADTIGTGGTVATDLELSTLPTETAPTVTSDVLSNTSPQDLANALRSSDVTSSTDLGLTGNEATDLSYFNANPTDTSYLNDYALTDTGTAQIGSGTSLSPDAANNKLSQFYNVANPEVQANTGTVSNLVGGGAESNLATLGTNPLLPTTGAGIGGAELGATGSIIGSGEGLGTQTLTDTLAPTGLNGLTVNDLNSQPLLNNGTTSTTSAKDVADALRKANQLKNLLSSNQQLAKNQQILQQSQALSNLLKTNQFTPIEAPPIYKAQNPFTFSPQEPIQGNPLASLLRNNYGNS